MKRTLSFLLAASLAATATVATAQQKYSEDGPTMGWSSWNTFALNINEQVICSQADAMVSGNFLRAGYRYLNIDDGYFGGRDADGHLLIHPERFPNGMKKVVDYIHSKGMKAGIYSDAGKNTCGSMFGGDKIGEGVGLYGHDQEDCDLWFKDLGFDFIKVDFCGGSAYHNKEHLVLPEEERYRAIWTAIQNTGRKDVRMNVCRWNYPGTWVNDVATSWRTTGDINCSWGSVKSILKENFYLSAYCSRGHYNDMDMLEVGRTLTAEEDRTHFGLWCIMDSPLLIGCDVAKVNATAKALLLNADLISLNQDTLFQQAHVVSRQGETYVLVKDIERANDTIRAVAVTNLSDAATTVTLRFADLDLGGKVKVRDLYTRRSRPDATETMDVTVPAHGTRIYRLNAEKRYERTVYEAETAFLSAYQELTNNQTAPSAIYQENDACSGGAKVGWLGQKAENDLQWRNVYSRNGGDYKMSLTYSSGEDRTIIITVNGKRVTNSKFNSGGWGTWATRTFDITLQPGDNIVRLYTTSGWMPDIDRMTLEPVIPTAINSTRDGHRAAKTDAIFRLNGQQVNRDEASLESGIYIIDGQKRLVM